MKLRACLACGLVLLVGGASLAEQTAPAKAKKPDIIQFRLVEEKKSADTEAMKLKGKDNDKTLHVNRQVLLNALDVEGAKATVGPNATPNISLTFTRDGAKKLARVTAENIGRRMAIVVDGRLLSAPIIRARIPGGRAVIAGDFTLKEARELAAAINASAAK